MSKHSAELLKIMQKQGKKDNKEGLQIGIMVDDEKIKLGQLTLDKDDYYYLDLCNIEIGDHLVDGHTLNHSIKQKKYVNGDKVLINKISEIGQYQYVLIGKLVSNE